MLGLILLPALLWLPVEETEQWTITDGSRVSIHTSAPAMPEEILEQVGVELGPGDTWDLTGVRQIRICRQKMQSDQSWQEECYTAVLEPETVRCLDPHLPAGKERILRDGRPGELVCRALVTVTGGVETDRIILEERIRVQPVSRIIAVGIGMELQRKREEPVIGEGLIFLPSGQVLTYDRVMTSLATAYCTKGVTATGTRARVGAIAVDPTVIPYGTRMFIVSGDGEYVYGIATAEDCGSREHIYDTRIDLYFDTYDECRRFGARYCKVYFLS